MRPTTDSKKVNQRSEHWRDLIQQQLASGQSVHGFCSERRLTEHKVSHCSKKRTCAKAFELSRVVL